MNSNNEISAERLIELETRLAHHERMTEELSALLNEQGRAVDRLALQLRRLTERVAEYDSGGSPTPPDDQPPPHY
ncbi:MAG: SlyX family protein [Alphaproteobacteria bacterium]|nr:SlyX family protein [Alphaproteobacteria bacterium]